MTKWDLPQEHQVDIKSKINNAIYHVNRIKDKNLSQYKQKKIYKIQHPFTIRTFSKVELGDLSTQ